MEKRVEQLQKKERVVDHRRHVQQEELITEQKPLEKRKLLEIWSSNDSRVGNFWLWGIYSERKAWSKAAARRNRVRIRGYIRLSGRVSSPESCSYISQCQGPAGQGTILPWPHQVAWPTALGLPEGRYHHTTTSHLWADVAGTATSTAIKQINQAQKLRKRLLRHWM